ncbi:hypothetical protein BH11MYX2_BH11MYX2_34620 [soil metagenome]
MRSLIMIAVIAALGVVHVGWRDRFVVIGRAADVTRALASTTPSTAWTNEIAELPGADALTTTAFAAVGHDPIFAGIVSIRPTRWSLTLDYPPNDWPKKTIYADANAADKGDALEAYGRQHARIAESTAAKHDPTFRGRITFHYGSPAEATLALSKLPRTLAGDALTLEFTQDSFLGVELEKLQEWLERVQAAAAKT